MGASAGVLINPIGEGKSLSKDRHILEINIWLYRWCSFRGLEFPEGGRRYS